MDLLILIDGEFRSLIRNTIERIIEQILRKIMMLKRRLLKNYQFV